MVEVGKKYWVALLKYNSDIVSVNLSGLVKVKAKKKKKRKKRQLSVTVLCWPYNFKIMKLANWRIYF